MYEVYGSITKKSLLDKASIVKERFKYSLRINMINDGKDIFIYEKN